MGTTFREHFSDAFPRDTFGLITGTNAVVQFPNVPGRLFRLKVDSASQDGFRLGSMQNTGSARMPWQLEAGYDTGWCAMDGNLNHYLYSNGSGSSYIMYWVQG